MKRCPVAAKGTKGAHELNAIIPETSADPVVLFCCRCGETSRISMDLPRPVDDWSAADIAALRKA